MNPLCQEAIFRAHAGLGTLGTLSQRARIFSQEVMWDIKIMDQSAVSQEDEVKLDEEKRRLFPFIFIYLLVGRFLCSKLFTYKPDRWQDV